MKIKPQTNPFFQTLSVTIRIATSLTPELKLTSIATSTYHLFCSCHVQRFFIHFVVKFTKWQDKVIVSLNLLGSLKLFLEAKCTLTSSFATEFWIWKWRAEQPRYYKSVSDWLVLYELCFFYYLHENLGDFNRITGLSFVFHMWKGLENVTEKHNFIRLRKENYPNS